MKFKYFIIILLLFFITSCTTDIKNENQLIDIYVDSSLVKQEYYINETLDLTNLKVIGKHFDLTEVELTDYYVESTPFVIGKNKVTIKYRDFTSSFEIMVKDVERIDIINHTNFSIRTISNLDWSSFKFSLDDVKYGVYRDKDFLICYDQDAFVSTNHFGYEIAIDKYGKVVEKATNVVLPKGGFVLSAHGSRIDELKQINLGDYVIYVDGVAYVYEADYKENYNYLYMLFEDVLSAISKIDNNVLYNEKIVKINSLIPTLETLFKEYDELLYNNTIAELELLIENDKTSYYNLEHNYSYEDRFFENIEYISKIPSSYRANAKYQDKLYIGGFRNSNTLVYYDESNYRSRNEFGYEIAVNEDGIVVEKDVLVSLPVNGYILSGHTSTASFLNDNVKINDKVEIKEDGVYFYRDDLNTLLFEIVNKRNQLVNVLNVHQNNSIPHDYEYICSIIDKIDMLINVNNLNSFKVGDLHKLIHNLKYVEEYINIAYSQLISYNPYDTKAIWYYPFANKNYDDTTIEGITKTITTLKLAGFNEIIINPFIKNYSLIECDEYLLFEDLNNYNYGEYGHDYLKCFIAIAHDNNITVNAFTQTFNNRFETMKNPDESFYQMDYQGEKSKGNIYYYDICNDNVQNMQISWYKTLVTNYDFDKVEYDIIRYPLTNLHNFNEIDESIDSSKIVDHGYTEYSINKFMNLYDLSGDFKELIRTNKLIRINWLKFKEDELIKFITNCTAAMREINPNIIVSAAVFPEYDITKKSYLQDYIKWLSLGIVDEIEPMVYTTSNKILEERIEYFNKLGIENIRYGISPRLDIYDMNLDFYQINATSNNGGYVLYSSSLYFKNYKFMEMLQYNHHIDNYGFLNTEEEKNNVCYEECINMINNYYQIKNNKSYQDLIDSLENKDIIRIKEEINKLDDEIMKNYLLSYLKKCN